MNCIAETENAMSVQHFWHNSHVLAMQYDHTIHNTLLHTKIDHISNVIRFFIGFVCNPFRWHEIEQNETLNSDCLK